MSTDNNLQSNAVWQSVSQITGKPPNAIRYAAVAASLLLLVLISWVGLLDGQSKDYIDSSLKQALVTYGVARGVNAFVSVLQTIHLVGLGVGEVLDPINGLVERFSGVMEWAIGSIFIQKVLLEISASFFFKAALTVSGGLLALSLYVRTGFNTLLLSRVFMTLAFARFSIALMLILNGSVTTAFVTQKIEADIAEVAQVEKGIPLPDKSAMMEEVSQAPTIAIASAPAPTDLAQPPSTTESEESEKTGLFAKLGKKLKEKAVALQGVGTRSVSSLKETAKKLDPKAIKEKLDKVIPQILNVMALFLLQTLLLPLLFLYGMKYAMEQIWNFSPIPLYARKPGAK